MPKAHKLNMETVFVNGHPKPLDKTRLANFVFVNGHPLNVLTKALTLDLVKTVYQPLIYLLADPRLANAPDFSTVVPLTGSDRSAPQPHPISKLHSQHLSDDRHKDVVNKALVKTRLANFVFENGHPLCRGMHEAGGTGRQGVYEGGARGVTTRIRTPATPAAA